MIPIFVYGTLKKKNGNNWLLDNISQFQGAALTVNPYPLFNFGAPGIFDIEDNEARNVYGEIYHIINDEDIRMIDALEGHPNFYERKIISVCKYDGTLHDVWCYFLDINIYHSTIEKYPNVNYLAYF